MPSVVFAEASWYGSLRGVIGSNADGQTGIMDGGSRFGVKGTSEVSEGLTSVYNFEHNIGPTGGLGDSGRHHYVGLSGGFGTLTIGQTWSASFNNIGVITDNSYFLGVAGTSFRTAGVKYSVSVENISIQADAVMNQGWGKSATAAEPAVAAHGSPLHGGKPAVEAKPEDDNVDQVEIGASMALGEYGKIAFAHISHDAALKVKKTTNFLAGQYTIGGMTAYLGLSQVKSSDRSLIGTEKTGNKISDGGADLLYKTGTSKQSGTFAGIRGSVGDTGLSYVFQVRKLKTNSISAGRPFAAAVPGGNSGNANKKEVTGIQGGTAMPETSSTPWVLSLSRSLGGGATVVFEHSDPDSKTVKSSSILALVVGF